MPTVDSQKASLYENKIQVDNNNCIMIAMIINEKPFDRQDLLQKTTWVIDLLPNSSLPE